MPSHKIAKGMLLLASKDIIGTAIAVVFFVLIARVIPSVADLGILTGLQTIILMFVILSGLGIPSSATRFISTYIGSGQTVRARNLYPLIFLFCLVLSLIFSLILYGLSANISDALFHNFYYTGLIQLTSLEVFLLCLVTVCIFLLTASLEFKMVAAISIITSVIKYCSSIILLLSGFELYGIILGFIVGDSIALMAFIFILRSKIFGRAIMDSSYLVQLKTLLRYSLPLYGSEILSFLSFRIDVYLLMILATAYLVGIYSPAVFVDGAFFILLTALDQAFLPAVSRIYGKSGTSSFKNSAKYVTRYLFLLYFPLGFALAASAPSLVVLTLGERYSESIYPIMILLISITLTSPFIVVYSLLRSAGDTSVLLKSSAISLVVQTIISIITIPTMGVLGVSCARFVSRFVLLGLPMRALTKIGGFGIDEVALRNGLGGSILIVLVIVAINYLVTGPYSIIVQYGIAFFSLLIFYRMTRAVDKNDIELIDKILSGKMKPITNQLARVVLH